MWKKVLLALCAPVLLLLLLELTLAAFGFKTGAEQADPYVGFTSVLPLFVPQPAADGQAVLETADNRRSHFNVQQFPERKAPGTVRIFCLGGSTTYGRPYSDRTSFCGWLRVFLPAADPSRRWEVINCGGLSYASYRIVLLMQELKRYDPDLFIVYTGHNEFLERRTYAAMLATPRAIRAAGGWASRTRTYAAIARLLQREAAAPVGATRDLLPEEVDAVLDRSIGPAAYERDDVLREKTLQHFEHSLDRMARIARDADAGLVLVTPASNLADCSPFKGAEASQAFRQGRELMAAGRHGEAGKALRRARDEDVCPLRALGVMPDMIRATAARHGVPVVDFEALVERASPHGIPGRDLFLDHVHPTVAGNRMLALAILGELQRMGVVTPAAGWGEQAVQEIAQRVEASLDTRAHGIALRNLAKVLGWAGKFEEGDRLIERAAMMCPDDADTQETLGVMWLRRGQLDAAAAALERAVALNPGLARAHYDLGLVRDRQGRHADAQRGYAECLRLQPEHADAHHKLGLVRLKGGDVEGAWRHYAEAVRIDPAHAPAHYGLGFVSMQRDDHPAAIGHYRKAIESNPQYASAHKNLGVVYLAQGNAAEAVACFEAALRINPGDAVTAENLRVAREAAE